MSVLTACITNLGKYNEGELAYFPLNLPTTKKEVQAALKRIGVDGVRYEELFITDYDSDISGLSRYLGEYENIDELNHLAHLIDDLSPAEVEILEAILEKGDHNDSAKELINLVQNLDCYIFYPDIRDTDDLGVFYVQSGVLEVPAHLENYFDYEAYGRDIAMEEDGEFVDGGYIVYGGGFTEIYSGRENIPDEHRIFAYPKLNIREQLIAYQEVADRAQAVPANVVPTLAHGDR